MYTSEGLQLCGYGEEPGDPEVEVSSPHHGCQTTQSTTAGQYQSTVDIMEGASSSVCHWGGGGGGGGDR